MKKKEKKPEALILRRQAEKLLKKKPLKRISQLSEAETLKFIHELEVHQIELELQNQELLLTRPAQDTALKYTELYDFAPVGYFTLSRNGEIIDLNHNASQLLGKERSQLKNSQFGFFVSDETKPIFNLFLEKVFNSRIKESCEVTLSTEDNLPRYVSVTGIVNENGTQCFITVVDITDRKQAEKAMIESQRLGAIGEMASSIAHDFNNSLQSISGNLELALLSSEFSDATLQYLNSIKMIVSDIADRVRLLQRFGGKKQDKSQHSLVDLNTLIGDVIIQLRPLWKDKAEKNGLSISIKTEYSEIPKVFVNDGELRTVLYNVLKNSIEAMPDGGGVLIKTEKKADGIYVSIADNGIGMDEKTSNRVFQPFYSTKGLDIGRGLGMSGAFSIIKEHVGKIYVKNTAPGKGTTIEILLPFSQKEETEVSGKIEKKVESPANSTRILWVEDDVSIGKWITEMYKILGYQGDLANSGKKALEYLEHKTYDLVITDIGMPEMSGWELADIIKEKYKGKMKVIVVSGWDVPLSDAEKIKHGIVGYLAKPFTINKLQDVLRKFQPV